MWGFKIKVLFPAIIEEKDIFKHNPFDQYYNDECYIYTSEYGIDITLTDRKSEYINKNMSLCEINCEYKGYNITIKKAECECKIKEELLSVSEVVKKTEKIINNFPDLKNTTNLKIIKCFKNIFTKEGLKLNIGNYVLLAIILITIVCLILFIFKEYKFIFNIMEIIVDQKYKNSEKDKTGRRLSKSKHINNNFLIIFKYKKKTKQTKRINILKTRENNKKDNSSYRIAIEKNNLKFNKQKEDILKIKLNAHLITDYNDYELNTLIYKEAIKIDKRSYIQYYLSLIKRKQLIIFTFFTKNDYNSRYIKICLFFFYFALSYAVNALFFNDATMHKIYVDHGDFNFIYQIPQILFSTIIISIINIIVTCLSLSEKNIINLKNQEGNKKEKMQEVKKYLIIKFSLFFILIIIFLVLFWYYLSCFCAIYKNTQFHLIKDTLISFGISLLYPFGICLIPGVFRIHAIKSHKEFLFKFSKFIQFI